MGTVYAAEQSTPITRRVALKVLKLGMDTRQFVARFEAERQALAVMDHPGIARVIDAGATEAGRPYFVMELVHGIPITEYCDVHRLDTRARIELMIDVCHAVQHAHQKGVIHRDLKPSNVLVSLQDGRAVPKIIDFGVAKAIDRKLTNLTLYTEVGQRIGTPAYMSPEQMEMSGLDIDTRSDVYSLGVVLYQLLTSALPFSDDLLLRAVHRPELLRETAPLTPSSRITNLGDRTSAVAAHRRTDAGTLRNQLKGDLDWITLKAMAMERANRYETANGFAMDLRRYLNDEPVVARPPSVSDRVRKFGRRHRVGVAAAAAALILIVVSTIGLALLAQRLAIERDRAESEAARANSIAAFLETTLSSADPWNDGNRSVTVSEALAAAAAKVDQSFHDQPLDAAAVRRTIASTYAGLGLFDDAERLARTALDAQRATLGSHHEEVARTLTVVATVHESKGQYQEAESATREALQIREAVAGREHEASAESLEQLAAILEKRGRYDDARAHAEESVAIRRRLLGPRDPKVADSLKTLATIVANGSADYARADQLLREVVDIHRASGGESAKFAAALNNLAVNYLRLEDFARAEAMYRESLEMMRRVLGPDHPDVAATLENLGGVYFRTRRYDEALQLLDEVLAMRRKGLGDNHTAVARTLHNLGAARTAAKDYAGAVAAVTEANARFRATLGPAHPELVTSLVTLGNAQNGAGSRGAAEKSYREALSIGTAALPADHPQLAIARRQLGNLLVLEKRFAEAEPLLLAAAEAREKRLGRDHATTKTVAGDLARLYDAWNSPQKAAEWRQRSGAQ
jgi:serine/threonine protein kinase